MKTILTTLSARMYKTENVKMEALKTNPRTKKERTALKVIYSHAGKRVVYETYLRIQPKMAQKYLQFIAKNPWELYIKWDNKRERFVA